MAVIVNEEWSDQECGISTDGQTARRKFKISGVSSAFAARSASGTNHTMDGQGVPAVNRGHPQNDELKVQNKTSKRLGFDLYEVVVNYAIPEDGWEHRTIEDVDTESP